MCTFWLVEALTRAGAYDKKYLELAVNMFENTLGFANHLDMFSEEISKTGEQLGNTPQAFSHLALISVSWSYTLRRFEREVVLTSVDVQAAYNLDRTTKRVGHSKVG